MFEITQLKAFDDNYIWMLHTPGSESAVVIDPGESAPVLAWLKEKEISLGGVLITHKHSDHTAGVMELSFAYPKVPVYGPGTEPIRGIKVKLKEGDKVEIPGLETVLEVLEVPGHTEGHIAYYAQGALFCGDTLFTAGCGGIFGGTHEQLHHSLQRLAQLPPETLVYCAHEYTLENLGFARWVEPDNQAILQREQEVRQRVDAGESTVPATLQLELETNPFLRTAIPQVIAAAEKFTGRKLSEGAEIFTAIRDWKSREYD